MDFDYDLFVIGAGSGGVRLSWMVAASGAKVAVAEQSRVGGTCVIRGCVPKKLLVYASRYGEDLVDAAGYGWQVETRGFSWETLIERKNREIDRLNAAYVGMLENAGVTLCPSRAVIADPHTVVITQDGRRITARHIVVATGAWPALPSIPGVEHAITSNEALEMRELPRRIAVVGGGYIAVEFAGIFNGLGSQVDLLYRGEQILRGFDDDVRQMLADEMAKKGIAIRNRTSVLALEKAADGTLHATLDSSGRGDYDAVLFATGRAPNTGGLGLEAAGVALDPKGAVVVDAFSRTSVESIHAIGDVTNRVPLTPVAINEGAALAATLFGGRPTPADHDNVPSAVFSQPEVGTVGMTEAEARAAFGELDLYKTSYRPMRHTLSGRDERSFMKLVVERASQRVVGAHMVGRDAAEIIQGVAIAVKMGASKAQFDMTVGVHPTSAEEFVTMRAPWAPPALPTCPVSGDPGLQTPR
ncbi:glutathione-disulfide reductase [Paraburkholderia lacunae]|uniref:Glutathione reductase n=1 Tax=Paraburkholderia lacunae TaxID=2211104 RepID=A0A370N6D6_9BURK|nr:glutathione-disulfide reductase [Paraburkholderia lacunae]RDK01170.1 glutathione-disulfide reductase [Paraburkholderia lacunae]